MIRISILILCLSFTSCSVHQRARNLVRQGWDKLDKAVKLDPSVRDSAYRYKTATVYLPAKSDSLMPQFIIDSAAMQLTLDHYDSLVRLIAEIKQNPSAGDDFFGSLAAVETEKKSLQKRLTPAFIKDSTYHYYPDTTLTVVVHTKAGLVTGIGLYRKAFVAKGKVKTVDVTYDASRAQPFYRDPWFIVSVVLSTILLAVFFIKDK